MRFSHFTDAIPYHPGTMSPNRESVSRNELLTIHAEGEQNITMKRFGRFDEATTLAWECPFCHKADVIPCMEAKWVEFDKDYEEIWEEINASKDHEHALHARVPELWAKEEAQLQHPFTGVPDDAAPAAEPYEAYKDDPERDDNHPRHQRGIALRFTESEPESTDMDTIAPEVSGDVPF
jgi:hypothetical protein